MTYNMSSLTVNTDECVDVKPYSLTHFYAKYNLLYQ